MLLLWQWIIAWTLEYWIIFACERQLIFICIGKKTRPNRHFIPLPLLTKADADKAGTIIVHIVSGHWNDDVSCCQSQINWIYFSNSRWMRRKIRLRLPQNTQIVNWSRRRISQFDVLYTSCVDSCGMYGVKLAAYKLLAMYVLTDWIWQTLEIPAETKTVTGWFEFASHTKWLNRFQFLLKYINMRGLMNAYVFICLWLYRSVDRLVFEDCR